MTLLRFRRHDESGMMYRVEMNCRRVPMIARSGLGLERHFEDVFGLQDFGMHDGEFRNMGIPFEQCRNAPRCFVRNPEQFPDRIDHRAIMSVDQMSPTVRMSGQVHLNNSLMRHHPQVFNRIEIVVSG